MNKLSLFSGIGGDDLASDWAGIETVCFVEKDKYCQQVLRKHWPEIPIIEDVKDVTKEKIMAYSRLFGQAECQKQATRVEQCGEIIANAESQQDRRLQFAGVSPDIGTSGERIGIDIISGGFPCQPHSVAGKRKGSSDERNLWPEFRRIIGEIKPRWVVAENVPGIFSSDAGRFFGEVLADLASLGYSAGWCTFGAVDVGAWHRRDRVFIVAYASERIGFTGSAQPNKWNPERCCQNVADPINTGLQGWERRELQECASQLVTRSSRALSDSENTDRWRTDRTYNSGWRNQETRGQGESIRGYEYWSVEPNVGRVAHGVPRRVDRLKGLGNAVVPQQIYQVYKAIVEIDGFSPPVRGETTK
jgi:DNA (cytosine-5)-methyltransferase 1